MNDYFQGAVKQHIERGRRLLERIPIDLPREFYILAQICDSELKAVLRDLESLIQDPKMGQEAYQPERLRRFRRAVEYLSFLERTGIAALERHTRDDEFLNRIIGAIRRESCYPLLPPVVSSLSQNYFHIHTGLKLLFVPLSEGDFLLHLPDLYHELGHPLIFEKYNPRVRAFQDAFFSAYGFVVDYIVEEKRKEDRKQGRAPQSFAFYLRQWEKSWGAWLMEFFCDLFATFTVGPAYAWSNFHLCAKLGHDPFQVPTVSCSTHPADQARMKAILFGLQLVGFELEIGLIKQRWNELLVISGAREEPEYRRCFPDSILEYLAQKAYEGVVGIGCCIATPDNSSPVYTILNQAWREFWRDPVGYTTWEHDAVRKLHELAVTQRV